MTAGDKKKFDSFFHSDKYFRNVTDIDLMRDAREVEKLYEYLELDLSEEEKTDIKRWMIFAYSYGKYGE